MGPCLGNNRTDESNRIKNMKLEIANRQLVVQEKIATGAYGEVWKCKDIKTGQLLAGKQIKLQNRQLSQMYSKQIKWLSMFSANPGIVKYIGSKVINRDTSKDGEEQSGVIVTEFYEISLYDLLKNNKFKIEDVHSFLSQLLQTLKFIHNSGCLHLDLKIQNILCRNGYFDSRAYYICDFGSSIEGPMKVDGLDRKDKNKLKQFIQSNSTLIYRAPEMIELNKVPITAKADIWMLGCVLYMLMFRKHPFQGQGLLSIMTCNINYDAKIELTGVETESGQKMLEKLMVILKGMLRVKIEERLSEDQLLKLLESA